MNRILASTLNLIFAFIVSNMLMQAMIYGLAYGLQYEPSFSFGTITTITDFHKWIRPHVVEIYFFPPLVCLAIGLFIYRAMRSQDRSWGRFQLLGYWLMMCFINTFFAQLFFSPLGVADTKSTFYQTFAIVMQWIFIPESLAAVFSIASCIACIMGGYILVIETVKLSYSYKMVSDTTGKNMLIVQMYIIPVVLCSLPILILAKGQADLRIIATIVNLLLFPLGMFLRNSISPYRVLYEKARISSRFPLSMLVITGAIYAAVFLFFRT